MKNFFKIYRKKFKLNTIKEMFSTVFEDVSELVEVFLDTISDILLIFIYPLLILDNTLKEIEKTKDDARVNKSK